MLHVSLFLITYVSGLLSSFIINPVFAFVLYEAVYFFHPLGRWWSFNIPSLGYSFFSVLLMALVLFIKTRKEPGRNLLRSAPQFKWIYILGFLYSIAWFYAALPADHLDAALNYVKLIIIISIAYKLIDTEDNLNYALWGYIYGCWYISFLIFQSGRNSGNRVEGIGTVDSPDSNGIAAALAPSLVICLYYVWQHKSKVGKLLIALAGVFIANALILINSRGSFLAAGLSIIFFMFYMYFSSFQQKYQKMTAVGITMLGLSAMLYLADDSFFERLQTMKQTEIVGEKETATTRVIFWESAWEMAKDYPFGAGVRGFDYHAPDYIPEGVNTGASLNRSVHSTWFEALTEIGYLGLIVFLLMLRATYKTAKETLNTLKERGDFVNYFKIIALESAFFSYLVAMSFMNRFRAEILYWIVLFIACAYNIYIVKANKEKVLSKDS
jgi:hypothetical protein